MSARPPADLTAPPVATGAQVVQLGLVGRGIQGSRTPRLHMKEAAAQGFGLDYSLIDLDVDPWRTLTLAEALEYAEARGFAGVNVTYPFKQEVMGLVQRLSVDAERVGAVNTISFETGDRVGHNTDWSGFAENLRRGLPNASLRRVVQLGAGGAGAAVAYALLREGVEDLVIFDLDEDRARDLVDVMNAAFGSGRASFGSELDAVLSNADGLVNATPVGMAKHPGSPLADGLLTPRLWVNDIVYVPLETPLLAAARACGCRVLDGGGMAVFQAAGAFRILTGRTPDAERMLAGFLHDLDART